MKKLITGFLAFLVSASAFAFGLGVSPTYSELTVEPGKIYRQKITVANMGTGNPLSIVVGLASWNIDDNGKMVLSQPTQKELDPTQWVKFSPTSFILNPQKNVEILVDISIPLNAEKKQYRVAVLSSTVLPSQEVMKKSKNVWEKVQVASLLYLTTSKTIYSDTKVSFISKGKTLEVIANNEGDKHSRIYGSFDFYDGENKVYKQDFNLVLMPKQTRKMEVLLEIPDNLKGKKLKIMPVLADTMSKDSNIAYPKETSYVF